MTLPVFKASNFVDLDSSHINFSQKATTGILQPEQAAPPEEHPEPRRLHSRPKILEQEMPEEWIVQQIEPLDIPDKQIKLSPSPSPNETHQGIPNAIRKGAPDTAPPDTHGTVGHRYIYEVTNQWIQIYDQDGSNNYYMTLNQYWDIFSGIDAFDPKMVYDPLEKRWIFVSMGNAESKSSCLLIGVTKTSDPTEDWACVRIPVDKSYGAWLDYPSVGFCKDKIVVQTNMYSIKGGKFSGSALYVFDKQVFYNPPYGASFSLIVNLSSTGIGATQCPAITLDPGQTINYLVSTFNSNTLAVFQVTGNIKDKNLEFKLSGGIRSELGSWAGRASSENSAPQKGTDKKVNTGDSRMQNVVFRNGTLWLTHTIFLPANSPSRSSIQWFQINPANAQILQQGRLDDPAGKIFYAFPSIAVNKQDDFLIGFSRFSKKTYPSAAYAYHGHKDPASTIRSPYVFKDGKASYYKTLSGDENRWGDYSSTVIDPGNNLNFWTVQEYSYGKRPFTPIGPGFGPDLWGTWWAKVSPD